LTNCIKGGGKRGENHRNANVIAMYKTRRQGGQITKRGGGNKQNRRRQRMMEYARKRLTAGAWGKRVQIQKGDMGDKGVKKRRDKFSKEGAQKGKV